MKFFYFLFFMFFFSSASAQLMGFKMPPGQTKIEIPFEYNNNFIIVNLIFDDVFPLKFIFDTGSENTILIKKEFTDILNISYDRTFRIHGADLENEMIAYLVRGLRMDLPNFPGPNLDMLVLQDDYFNFEMYTGLKIHGILGMDLFKTFTIQIDYKKRILTFYRVENFKVPSNKFKAIDAEIHRNKPYIIAKAKIKGDTTTEIKLLMDTGASLALLLHNNTSEALILPDLLVPGKIGNGLGGFIEGFIGRINQLSFNNFVFNGVITNFQEIKDSASTLIDFNRNGILGNEIMSRFTVIFDFSRSKVYLKPIKKYNKHFKYDKSGITLIASGKKLDTYLIKELIPNSPAAQAGVKIGDVLKNINFIPSAVYDLRQITRIFQKRKGKRIRLVVMRDGVKQVIKFRLRNLI